MAHPFLKSFLGWLPPSGADARPARRLRSRRKRVLAVESLEERRVMTSLPLGAMANDTAEFMLGRIVVTPVLLESNGAIDPNAYNWNAAQAEDVFNNVRIGMDWWSQLLAKKSSVHTLDWVIDRTYLDAPVPTSYEPIKRISNDYVRWVPEFLNFVNYNQAANLESNMRLFNDAQRQKHNADWSFTIFVVNSAPGDLFANGGSFSRAFAFAGGLYFVTPSNRPASTYTHETGHIFYARDEYSGSGGNYNQRRGYYNSQNTNAIDLNPTPGFQQAPSIMSAGITLDAAYNFVESPASTLAQIGWQDSDGDGIFDVLDVPLELDGIGSFHPTSNEYRFTGKASAKTLPNRNGTGLQNDITLNKVGRYEYRFNQSNWTTLTTLATPTYQTNVDLRIPVPNGTTGTIEIRAVDLKTGVTSNVFLGELNKFDRTSLTSLSGFVWSEKTNDGQRQLDELGLAGQTVQLVDANGSLRDLQKELEPDALPLGEITGTEYVGVMLQAVGNNADGTMQVSSDTRATTGSRVFTPYSVVGREFAVGWRGDEQKLEATFTDLQASVAVDVFGISNNSYARLEAYSATGELLERVTSASLSVGQATTLRLTRISPDIRTIVVKGHLGTMIGIDNLRAGVVSETTTGSAGEYSFDGLLPGSYRVRVVPNNSFSFTSPSAGVSSTTVVAGQSTPHVDFGMFSPNSPWQNQILNVDVNDDGSVTPIDVLQVINALTRSGSGSLESMNVPTRPFVDVDGDRNISPIDVLVVINYLRRQTAGSGEGEQSTPPVVITENITFAEADGEPADLSVAHLFTGDEEAPTPHLVNEPTVGSTPASTTSQTSRPTPSPALPSSPLSRRRHLTGSLTNQDLTAVDQVFSSII